MTNISEEIIDEVEVRSRKGRTKSNVYFYGVKGDSVKEVEMSGDVWSVQEATAKLKSEIGADVQVLGPFYKVKSALKQNDKEQIQVRLDLMKLNFTKETYTGNHNNWVFTAKGIAACEVDGESFGDDDLVFIEYTGLFDDSVKTRKPRNGGRIVVRKDRLDEVIHS